MFVNIHNHTDLGSFDSIMTQDAFIKRILDLKQCAVVQTDHGTLRGTISLSMKAHKAGLKYIPGIEVYLYAHDVVNERDAFARYHYHMILIAMNECGRKNLLKLLSRSYSRERMYHKPRITLSDLQECHEGIIATSGCVASMTSQSILCEAQGFDSLPLLQKHCLGVSCEDNVDAVPLDPILFGSRNTKYLFEKLLTIFPDRFYGEVQDSGCSTQQIVNDGVIHYCNQLGIPIIATADAHYANPDEASLRSMSLRIRHNQLDDESDFYDEGKLHLKSAEELSKVFPSEYLSNTVNLANRCEGFVNKTTTMFPALTLRESPENTLVEKALAALSQRGLSSNKEYVDRLNYELEVINSLGFAPYFLVIQKAMDAGKKVGIPFGPGRGSAAGSLVSYCLKITTVDPIKHGLFFSRFLNKSRVSLPDIDIDIDKERRDEFIDILGELFGVENVAQIMTFAGSKPRGLAKDLGRAIGNTQLGTEVSRLIPPGLHGKEPTWAESLERVPELLNEKYDSITCLMNKLEGVNRSVGVHAGGIVISPEPIATLIPTEIQYKKKIAKTVVQADMNEVEKAGLVKIDFLGLRTLTAISKCLASIGMSLEDIPIDDNEIFKKLRETKEYGTIFQLESPAMAKLVNEIQPRSIDDISIGIALFRPGPLGAGMDKKFLYYRSHPDEIPTNMHPKVAEITIDTGYSLIYQEQVISLCIKVAGFTEEDADSIRKILGKKLGKEVEAWRPLFIDGCVKNSHMNPLYANELFENIAEGSSYLFNKSHSIAYAYLSYYCAYLRFKHEREWFSAVIDSSTENKNKLLNAVSTCKNVGLGIYPPDLKNLSMNTTPHEDGISLGVSVCRNMKSGGEALTQAMRKSFVGNLYSLFMHVNRNQFNAAKAVSMAKAGVFDRYAKKEGLTRTGLITAIPDLYAHFHKVEGKIKSLAKWQEASAKREEQERLKAQGLDYGGRLTPKRSMPEIPDEFDFSPYKHIHDNLLEIVMNEHEILGLSISGFPTDYMNTSKNRYRLKDLPEGENVSGVFTVAGLVLDFKEMSTKTKATMARFILEDESGLANCVIFPGIYAKTREKLDDRSCIEAKIKIIANEEDKLEISLISYRVLKPVTKAIDTPSELVANSFKELVRFIDYYSKMDERSQPVNIFFNKFQIVV